MEKDIADIKVRLHEANAGQAIEVDKLKVMVSSLAESVPRSLNDFERLLKDYTKEACGVLSSTMAEFVETSLQRVRCVVSCQTDAL